MTGCLGPRRGKASPLSFPSVPREGGRSGVLEGSRRVRPSEGKPPSDRIILEVAGTRRTRLAHLGPVSTGLEPGAAEQQGSS